MQFKIYVSIITKEGKITNASIIKGLKDCPECDEEALRLVSSMPDWDVRDIDEKMNPFPISYTIPITFKEKDLYQKK
jgi:protein TonB